MPFVKMHIATAFYSRSDAADAIGQVLTVQVLMHANIAINKINKSTAYFIIALSLQLIEVCF